MSLLCDYLKAQKVMNLGTLIIAKVCFLFFWTTILWLNFLVNVRNELGGTTPRCIFCADSLTELKAVNLHFVAAMLYYTAAAGHY